MERIQIYCDGGCRGNHQKENVGGWGVYLIYKGKEKGICGGERNTTNNRMELKGCINGLKSISEAKRYFPVEVFLDSAYVLNGITKWVDGWVKKGWINSQKKPVENKELWMELLELKKTYKDITFTKVKGHSTNYGNNMADKLANDAMDNIK